MVSPNLKMFDRFLNNLRDGLDAAYEVTSDSKCPYSDLLLVAKVAVASFIKNYVNDMNVVSKSSSNSES